MGLGIKKEQGQAQQTHQLIMERFALQLMDLELNLALKNVLVTLSKLKLYNNMTEIIFFQWIVSGKHGLHGQAALIPVLQWMGPVIKKEQGQAQQIHQPIMELLAMQLMEVELNLALKNALVTLFIHSKILTV